MSSVFRELETEGQETEEKLPLFLCSHCDIHVFGSGGVAMQELICGSDISKKNTQKNWNLSLMFW